MSAEDRVNIIFDAEVERAEDDVETTAFMEWLERLRDKVLAALSAEKVP